MGKQKKYKQGKIKRFRQRLKLYHSGGFGNSLTSPTIAFRVEMNWRDPETEDESNEQIHWIECRKITGEERRSHLAHLSQLNDVWQDRETIESKFVCVYVAKYICNNKDVLHLNQAFVYPGSKLKNETIREPIYIVRWSEDLCKGLGNDKRLDVALKNSVHHYTNNN